MNTRNLLRFIVVLVVCACAQTAEAKYRPRSRSRGKTMQQNQVYAGARLGIGSPQRWGRKPLDVAFTDVVSNGFALSGEGMWMSTPYVGLGGEINYQSFPYKEQFWVALNHRGTFDATYRDVGAGLIGRVIMGKKKVKPYFGGGVSCHYLRNTLDFEQSDAFAGSSDDNSVSYTYGKLHPGGSIDFGIFYMSGKKTYLSLSVRFNIVQSVKEEKVTTIDPYSFIEKTVVVNPHGTQNNIVFSAGLHFATRKKLPRRSRYRFR